MNIRCTRAVTGKITWFIVFAALLFPSSALANTDAETFIQSSFSYITAEGYHPQLPSGQSTAPDAPGERFLQYYDSGRMVHAFAFGPFAFTSPDGKVASVDTSLVPVLGGGWRATSVPYTATLPSDLSAGVTWQDVGSDQQVRIYPQDVNTTPGHVFAGTTDTILYEDAWNHAHMTLAATAEGIKDHIVLTQANGVPNQFKFRVDRPTDATTSLGADGGVRVLAANGSSLAKLPPPVGRDRDHQEFRVWYEVESHSNFDVIVLHYDTSSITGEGTTTTFEPPYDLDPALFTSESILGSDATWTKTDREAAVTDRDHGNLRVMLLARPDWDTGDFAQWAIHGPASAGSRWASFSSDVDIRLGLHQTYTIADGAGNQLNVGHADGSCTYLPKHVEFVPTGTITSRIQSIEPHESICDYYGTLTNAVALYEDLVDPSITGLTPASGAVVSDPFAVSASAVDSQSGCEKVVVTVYDPNGHSLGVHSDSDCHLNASYSATDEGAYSVQAVAHDRSGRVSSTTHSFTVNLPIDPPSSVSDGLGEDESDWTNSATDFSAHWENSPGAASYEVCFTLTAPCTTSDRWTGFSTTEASVGGYGFAEGDLVFACVRSVNLGGGRTLSRCSNGQRIDLTPPTAPPYVYDGDIAGLDVNSSASTLTVALNWGASSDNSGLTPDYEYCATSMLVACADIQWSDSDLPDELVETAGMQMLPGDSMRSCARARDAAGNESTAVCSNGFTVTPAQSEIDSAIQQRIDAGLPADPTVVENQLLSGDYNPSWISDGIPVTQAEMPGFSDRVEVQTWEIDHADLITSLANNFTLDIDPVTRKLIVTVPQRACSPRVESHKAFGKFALSAPVLARQRPYTPLSTREIRHLVKTKILSNPEFQAIGIRGWRIKRKGVARPCLSNIADWLNNATVRDYLARHALSYDSAEAPLNLQSIVVHTSSHLALYPGASSTGRRSQLIKTAPLEVSSVTSCGKHYKLSRNVYFCDQGNTVSGILYHSGVPTGNGGAAASQYGGCTTGFAGALPKPLGGYSEFYVMTARHCHDSHYSDSYVDLTNHAQSSWHWGRYLKTLKSIGDSRDGLDSTNVDLTAISTGVLNIGHSGLYATPLASHPHQPRVLGDLDVNHGITRYNAPVLLTMLSSRPSAEGRNPQPNGVASGTYIGQRDQSYLWGPQSVSVVSGMKACKGDSGSGVLARVKYSTENFYRYRPFGVQSTERSTQLASEQLYGIVPSYYQQVPYTDCSARSGVAPAYDYFHNRNLVPIA